MAKASVRPVILNAVKDLLAVVTEYQLLKFAVCAIMYPLGAYCE
jgi:hypothetical protein